MGRRYVHVVNAVALPEREQLYVAQKLTFETMRRARDMSGIDVSFLSAHFPEDGGAVPAWFESSGHLTRSLLDFGVFNPARKLPLLGDVLDAARNVDADYVLYTNVDIGLMPHFYTWVDTCITRGCHACSINRRDIALEPNTPERLQEIWEQSGVPHPGSDCFMFPHALLNELDLDEAVIGMPWVGFLLLANLLCCVPGTSIHEDLRLTFHLGCDRTWGDDMFERHREHNQRAAMRVMDRLAAAHGPFEPKSRLHVHHRLAQQQVAEQARRGVG